MSRLSITFVAAVLLSALCSPALAKAPFSIANAWDGRGNCLQSVSQVEGRVRAERSPVLAAASPRDQRLAYMKDRYGYTGSSAASGNVSGWSAADLDELLVTLSDLPANAAPFDDEVLRPLVFDEHFHPNGSGVALVNGATLIAYDGPSGIRVVGAWRALPQQARRVAIFHELAHEFLRQRGAYFNWRPHWDAAVRADEAFARQNGFDTDRVSTYAAASVAEDFAESAAAYRYMPLRLKQRAPNRYKLLKTWMFDGLEYVSSSACAADAAKSERAVQLARQGLAAAPSPIAAFKAAWKSLSPRGEAVDIAALEAFLNSRRLTRRIAQG